MDNAPSNAPWKPDSWQARKAVQLPVYRDAAALASTIAELGRLPPLVTSWEIEALKARLAQAQQGRAFVLQGGDCAETFADCSSENIVQKLKILLQMSMVIVAGLKRPVVRVGRIAGQYAKPRSDDLETRDGLALPSYRGDLVNRSAFTATDREPDPALMLRGYEYAALTLNFVRGLIDGGFADIHHPENWNLAFVSQSPMADRYHQVMRRVTDGLAFFEAVTGTRVDDARRIDFFASHEGLNLYYEQAQTRWLRHRSRWYDLTTHYPWIGARTAAVDGAHVEYFRGIANPIGVKIGPGASAGDVLALLEHLNPRRIAGRVVLITRMGAGQLEQRLPPLLTTVRDSGHPVVWSCDPMHGNTVTTAQGVKTRDFGRIVQEVREFFAAHQACGTVAGGLHVELTGLDVTECRGGGQNLGDADLAQRYTSACDPRLNGSQSLELAFLVADLLKAQRHS